MHVNFEGKVALVTGASGGIGEEIAKDLHAHGATVAISGTRAEKLEELKTTLCHPERPQGVEGSQAANSGGRSLDCARDDRIHIFPCNLSDREAVKELAKQVEEKLGSIDILVNNAGITKDGLAMRMSDEDWDAVLNVNLTASFTLIRACLRGMMKRKSGRIINISSVVGTSGNPGQANYVASKAAMNGLTKSLAQEVASRGITVNSVAPGFIKTAMTDKLTEEQQARITATVPMGSFGLPVDIANAVTFLSSEGARYITGQTIHVNGGMLMV